MENSDSNDEGDGVSAQHISQTDRLVREEDFSRFVNNLSEEDYELMRDNNLLGIPGESTEEELLRRLQLIKGNAPQDSDENTGDSSDDVSSGDSLIDWLNCSGQTENMTSGQRENQSWREESLINPKSDQFIFSLEINVNLDNGSPNPENEYVASARLPRRENMEDSQRQVESPQSESIFTRPSMSEQDTTETLMEFPPTTSQRRARSRSPEYRRTRARIESWSPPCSLREIVQRLNHSIPSQNFEQPLLSENARFSRTEHQEILRQQMTGFELQNSGLIETSRTRNAVHGENSPDTTSSGESWGMWEIYPTITFNLEVGQVHSGAYSQRDSRASRTQLTSETPNNTVTSESERGLRHMYSHSEQAGVRAYVNTIRNPVCRTLNTRLNDTTSVPIQSTLRQTMAEFSNSSNLMDSDSNSNASYDTHSSSTMICHSRPNCMSSSSSSPISGSSSSDENSGISSLMFEGSEETNLSSDLSSETSQGGRQIILDSNLEHSVSPPSQNMEWLESSNGSSSGIFGSDSNASYDTHSSFTLICHSRPNYLSSETNQWDRQIILDSNLEHSVSPPSQNMEWLESSNGSSSGIFGSDSNASYDTHSSSTLICHSRPSCMSSSSSSPISGSSSSDENSGICSLMFEGSEETNLSSDLSSETSQGGRQIILDSNLEHSVSPPSQNMEWLESSNGSSSGIFGSDSNASYDTHSSFTLICHSRPNCMSSSSSSPISGSSSSDENSGISSLMFEGSEETNLSSDLSSETSQGGRQIILIISDESDSGSSHNLQQFFLLNEDDPYQTTGLTKAQIDSLAVRSFGENDALNACSICLTEYTENSKLRILPCSHEYHIHCIDRWLSENSTCPICRRQVVDSNESENPDR
ncbi:E3 ubiquitin-protein ligase RLIM-like [Mesoplodon densirostris]|uniref:E3 ubiquitin-protein ligase RLIM-like n=1 Tax=Mesoplodon densirostris TaxID=48708 RepID=UPI0028DB935A|nr:E3 ubiquitin-protein ligase RLIM-like [Mesoplodon densirostris]